ncbi:hypothetical protein A7U58_17505 [Burkholderia pseudomallei]|nr:hypothetical protein A7U58_17505 [Burkholderia pseudomallei]ANW57710.1 hypothetical protein A7U59_17465 [Burkholderia pseudomallei]
MLFELCSLGVQASEFLRRYFELYLPDFCPAIPVVIAGLLRPTGIFAHNVGSFVHPFRLEKRIDGRQRLF